MNELPFEHIELELSILARLVASATTYRKEGMLDRSAYLLLQQISSRRSAGVKALADDFRLDISTVSRQSAALEQKGLAYRIPNPQDGRSYSLELTEAGALALEANRKVRADYIAELLAGWSDEEQKQFGALLEKFNRACLQDHQAARQP
ncbi:MULTISPECIES: MarR family transcriptional regulator [unclassified Paenibacillus]|uniref:MarR family winged helix-turn-helix transcriptional regulator n=1 Tax=unclassified Paenibacillus TaxID=185978 RepID=UPI000953C936|nr:MULTISPECIES: MarR family transcriptional regulator [unclassified Paenibacillus]ASS66121.1 MarR family transcriptional regulator [Paenibacillus sp. RUD330]SIQ11958.1 DNA-binding transcriptional regulator, MarR family [Paenibacillus sp. RU4X]SIQ33480.1 DNA-binding transcriptional regulator, MarR family [Paenibacillus sp. RU4T]